MLTKSEIKYWLRSGSLRFALDSRYGTRPGTVQCHYWHGKPLHYRPGTSDTSVIYNILLKQGRKSEYWVPAALHPSVIWDIGGNIGITAIYFATRFPRASIFSFEPVPENFALLSKNVASFTNIRAFPWAIGREDTVAEMRYSDDPHNFGGCSFFEKGVDISRSVKVQVRGVNTLAPETGAVDLIKIDTEGAEYEILTALDEKVLRSVKWIVGELHGERDFELLAYMSRWFDISARKSFNKRLFIFRACNRAISSQLNLND